MRGGNEVYRPAANISGTGFIEIHKGGIFRDRTMINIYAIEAARIRGVRRFVFTLSARV